MKTLIIFAHPHSRASKVNRPLLKAAEDLDNVTVRDLYQLYPDFKIDVAAEQAALEA
ncbi:NAD(P)H-dependent oxidoreductase, partial [Lactobacillus nasalidis]